MATVIKYKNKNTTTFDNIVSVEMFYARNCLYIATEVEIVDENDEPINAVALSDGSFDYFNIDEEVEKVDVEITVRNKTKTY